MLKRENAARTGAGVFLIATCMAILGLPQAGSADGISIAITVDENGHGRLTNTTGGDQSLPFTLQNDVGPGGQPNVLTYSLLNPPGLTAGDLLLSESPGGVISDVIRFNPTETCSGTTGCLVFYSDALDGTDGLADILFPTSFYTNKLTVLEVGLEGSNGFVYTPLPGQPGFVAGAAGPITYVIQSDVPSNVPEPSSVVLLATGLSALIIGYRGRRRLP